MKARLFLPVIALTFCNLLSVKGLDVDVTAEAAVLIDAQTGSVLYEKRAHEQYFPASITKVATALSVLEACHDLTAVTVAPREAVVAISTEEKKKRGYRAPSHWIEFNSSHVGIKKGEQLTVETLLYGLMLQSGNDAANVLAHHVASDIPAFVDQLNARLKKLGCTCTHFTNPHGLHHPEHVTCAYDMALITAEALKHPPFRTVVGSTFYKKPKSNLQPATTWMQKNQLVRKGKEHYYPKAIGIKCGFTQDSQGTLIAAAEDQGRTLIAVVLRCEPFANTYRDVTALFEAAFNEQKVVQKVLSAGPQPYKQGRIRTTLANDLMVETYPSREVVPQLRIEWMDVEFPLAKGSEVGQVVITDDRGAELARAPLLASRSMGDSLLQEIPLIVSNWPRSLKGALLGTGGLFLFFAFVRRRR
jgi:serine-type D-Ala-D-Ala carboxypeptidase (penicillin-binding protein 5/6)